MTEFEILISRINPVLWHKIVAYAAVRGIGVEVSVRELLEMSIKK